MSHIESLIQDFCKTKQKHFWFQSHIWLWQNKFQQTNKTEINHINEITKSLRFLYIFGGCGLLCAARACTSLNVLSELKALFFVCSYTYFSSNITLEQDKSLYVVHCSMYLNIWKTIVSFLKVTPFRRFEFQEQYFTVLNN